MKTLTQYEIDLKIQNLDFMRSKAYTEGNISKVKTYTSKIMELVETKFKLKSEEK